MKINTALILCAGYGKRLNPLTLEVPKPLLKINNTTMLGHTINFIEQLGIKNIKINTFHLEKQIEDFIFKHPLKYKIDIINDGKKILDTGGGILNLIKSSEDKNFLVFNPDTLWNSNYLKTINNMIDFYFKYKIENILMVVNKKKSYDLRFKGDFQINENTLSKQKENNFIYTGCQIINKKLFKELDLNVFSISKIWNKKLRENNLYGYQSYEKFIHITDLEIYNKLIKY
jgi:N-acetyl-alpha-D-muramate 1-phosphate uridylyltransferase|tara:strand:+ start:1282 stop:1971 length:690 start_codon:yes stop_codon:yes gene_type:complete